MNLNQVTVPSLDIPSAITFYKKLGLKLIVHTHDAYARFECPDGESTFSIHKVEKLPKGKGLSIYFEIQNLDHKVARLRENGIAFTLLPTDQNWLWREAHLNDLDGNNIILYYAGKNRKNPPWRISEKIETTATNNSHVEIERKYLVKDTSYKKLATKHLRITQGYLSTDPNRTVRVRINGDQGYLTIKGKSSSDGTTRVEVEEQISLAKAKTLLSMCLPGVIDKSRYLVPYNNHTWEVDEFYGENEGLQVAEIELSSATEQFEIPNWVGAEVTGDKKYYNSQLSTLPYKKW